MPDTSALRYRAALGASDLNHREGQSAAWGRVFVLRRVYGFACIADGIGHLLGLRFGLGLRSAKTLAKARHDGR